MKKYLTALSLLVFLAGIGRSGVITVETTPRAIQDPKTKVVYYLESDRRHVAAISPAGNLLWCCEAVPLVKSNAFYIAALEFSKEPAFRDKYLCVSLVDGGIGIGSIDMKTGRFIDSGIRK
jgi:hypothetical protein